VTHNSVFYITALHVAKNLTENRFNLKLDRGTYRENSVCITIKLRAVMFEVRVPVEGLLILLFCGYKISFLGIRLLSRLVNHSYLSSYEFKIEWSYTSFPLYAFVGWTGITYVAGCTVVPGYDIRLLYYERNVDGYWGNWVARFLSDWTDGWTTFPSTCRDFHPSP
jgi:hypothetical protein